MTTSSVESKDYSVLFVGGAPRSGTTVTHALICTSSKVNRYVAESSYLSHLVRAYKAGRANWDAHTSSFFAKPEHFYRHMSRLFWFAINRLHTNLGEPQILALKDPLLSPLFPEVMELLGARVRFVAVVRNPYDVVRSRQEVHAKMYGGQVPFGNPQARHVAQEYMESYKPLADARLKDRVFVLQYERIVDPSVLTDLGRFVGVDDIDPDRIWGGPEPPEKAAESARGSNDPWYSPKYRRPLNIEKRLSDLSPEFKAIVDQVCAPIQNEFAYPRG